MGGENSLCTRPQKPYNIIMSKNILIGVIIVIVIAGGLYYILVVQKAPPPQVTPLEPLETEQGLGSELLQNPGTLVPETNPFQEVDTNPLQGTNPFEGGSKNPFE